MMNDEVSEAEGCAEYAAGLAHAASQARIDRISEVISAAEAMFDAWERAEFGSEHVAITDVLIAVGKMRGRIKD
jgi:hypothetical protein